ncbi:MAG TPA: WD40 repeat domain-containing protein [Gemmataceae bacterium]|nr:WD40 repeat domain-containing protein [Gemmataceae bacterium]
MRSHAPIHPWILVGCVFGSFVLLTPIRADNARRTDVHGDPLPDGALARLGTNRLRAGHFIVMTAFLPDGKLLLTVTHDWIAQVWDCDTGRELRSFSVSGPLPEGSYRMGLDQAVLSNDGKRLACGGYCAVRVWDVASGKEVCKIGDLPTNAVAFSADSKTLVTREHDQRIATWDAASGKQLRSFSKADDSFRFAPCQTALSPDGKMLVQAGVNWGGGISAAVVIWDVVAGKECRRYAGERSASGYLNPLAAAIAPDAKLLAWPGDNKVKLIDLTSGQEVRQFDGNNGKRALAFSRDGKQLVALSARDEALTVWDMATGKVVRRIGTASIPTIAAPPDVKPGPALELASLSLSPNGKLVAWGDGPTVRLVDLETGKERHAGAGHTDAPRQVVFSRDGKTLLTAGDDATVRRWDAVSGKEIGKGTVLGQPYISVFVSPDERVLAAACEPTGTVHLIDASSGKQKPRLPPHGQSLGRIVAFSPDSRALATLHAVSAAVEVFDVAGGKRKQALELPSPEGANDTGPSKVGPRGMRRVFFSPDGRFVAATNGDVLVWDTTTGRQERQLTLPEGVLARAGVFSPDGRTIAAETTDDEIELWELASGQKRLTIKRPAKPKPAQPELGWPTRGAALLNPASLAFSPDGRLLAQVDDRTARLWDLYTGQEVAAFSGHRGRLTGLAFAPDGRRLATISRDTTGLLWDAAMVAKKLTPLTAPLAKEKLEELWTALGAADGVMAFRAIRALAGDPAQAMPFLAERVKPLAAPDRKQVAKLIADLDADAFDAREAARKKLESLGPLALDPLREALKGHPSAEQRRVLEELVKTAAVPGLSGERLRMLRALEALELAATPEAVKILKAVADGPPDTLPTEQARAILDRLGRK